MHNKIEWNEMGVYVLNSVYNRIEGNTFDRQTTYGMKSEGVTHLNIISNTFERDMENQLYLSGSFIKVHGNMFATKHTEDDQSGTELPLVILN